VPIEFCIVTLQLLGVASGCRSRTNAQSPSDPDCWWTWQGCTQPDPSLNIPADLYDIPTPNTLSLTIDDGPNCSQNAFYDFLRQQNQKVSM
jgi:hypothetical protein